MRRISKQSDLVFRPFSGLEIYNHLIFFELLDFGIWGSSSGGD